MKEWLVVFICFSFSWLFGQQNNLPISSYFKDQLFNLENSSSYRGSSFLPRSEGEYNLLSLNRDSSVQYYELAERLFKKHLVEIKGDGYLLTMSPTLNIGLGKDFNDTTVGRLFNNTRGFLVELDLLKKVSFSTSFYENQNRFTSYENNYYSSIGERYISGDAKYYTQNGIVPGGARTKPYKGNGFDYGYAIGNVVFQPTKSIRVSGGNNAHFIGLGHRSLFLSDNSVPSIYIRGDFKLGNKLEYSVLRSKQFNLLRRPIYTTVESYYEQKLYSLQFLNYAVSKNLSISLFEGSYWNIGDSISSKSVNPSYYIPVPFVGALLMNDANEINSLAGFQMEYRLKQSAVFYSQLALSNWNSKSIGSQIGMRYYGVLGLRNSMLQLEYNNVPKRLYLSENSRLNYSSYNLPSAHPKGNGFQEYLLRFNYTKKRFYGDVKSIFYQLKNYQEGNLIAVNNALSMQSGQIFHQQTELGYRMNTLLNLEVFVQHVYRNPLGLNQNSTNAVFVGLRTGLINHYNDF